VPIQTVDATPSGIKLFFKGGVYEARETVRAFRGAEDRGVASLEGGPDAASDRSRFWQRTFLYSLSGVASRWDCSGCPAAWKSLVGWLPVRRCVRLPNVSIEFLRLSITVVQFLFTTLTSLFNQKCNRLIRGVHKRHMLSHLFTKIAENMTFYFAYGLKRRARYLSDISGETDFLDWMTSDDEEMTTKTGLLRELQHTVPVLGELPIATILRIRQQEKDAFEAYRQVVSRMSSSILTAQNLSRKEVREMLRDAIEPELRRMNRDLRTYRRIRRSQGIGAAMSTAAGVILGAYAGLPSIASLPLAAGAGLVGGRLAAKAAEEACSHGPEFKQKNDLYFLLRLKNEAE
jgi:hypothetical protein